MIGEDFGAGVEGQEVGEEGELEGWGGVVERLRRVRWRKNAICRVKEGLQIRDGAGRSEVGFSGDEEYFWRQERIQIRLHGRGSHLV